MYVYINFTRKNPSYYLNTFLIRKNMVNILQKSKQKRGPA